MFQELKKKSVNINASSLETETPVGDELLALQSQDESKLYQTLVSITNEFSKETKVVQSHMQNYVLREDSGDSSTKDNSDGRGFGSKQADLMHDQEDECGNNEKTAHDKLNDELKMLYKTTKDLEIKNEMLNQKQMEEKIETEQLQKNMILLNETIELIKTQLKYSKECFEQGNFNFDNLNSPQAVENDIIKDLNFLVTNFMYTKSELEKLKGFVVNIENELKISKDEIDYLKTKAKQDLCCVENQSDRLIEMNNELKEQLESLQNENNDRLAQQESLHDELEIMRKQNENLKVEIKETKTLLESSEQLLHNNKKEFNEIKTSLENEKKILEDKIIKLSVELDDTKTKTLSLLNLKESLSNEISTLIKENERMSIEKENLQLSNEEFKIQTDQCKTEHLPLKTHNASLTEEISEMKSQLNYATTENSTLLENICKLEKSNKELTDALTESKEKCENVQVELSSTTKNNDDINMEKYVLQCKIDELEKSVDQVKKEYSRMEEEKDSFIKELSLLKNENEIITEEKKHLNEKITTLVVELDSKMKHYSELLEDKNILSSEVLNLRNENSVIITNNNELELKYNNLDEELNTNKREFDKLITTNKQLSVDISSLKEDINKLNNLNKELKIEIESFENINSENSEYIKELNVFKKTIDGLENELEVCKQENEKTSALLKDEIISLKKDKEISDKERQNYLIVIEELNAKIDTKEAEYFIVEESKNKLFDELRSYKKEQENLVKEKEHVLKKLESLEEEVKNGKTEISSSLKLRDYLSNEILILKEEIDNQSKKITFLQEELDKLVKEGGENQAIHESVLLERNKLSDEIVAMKREYEEIDFALNNAKKKLISEQESCTKLNNQLQELSESYKNKCNDFQQENAKLKIDAEKNLKQFNTINASLDLMTNERNELFKKLLMNVNTVKAIRKMQLELFSFVGKYKKEVTDELNSVKLKISKDFVYQVNNVLKTYEDHDKQMYELQCKSKKETDLYNSKIKSLQDEIQSGKKLTNENVTLQCPSDSQNVEVAFNSNIPIERTSVQTEENVSELNSVILIYKNRCKDMELSLNHALLIMRSILSYLTGSSVFHNSVLTEGSTVLETKREENIDAKERELKIRKKQIGAIESFLEEHETKARNNKHAMNTFSSDVGNDINEGFSIRSNVVFESDGMLATSNHFNQPLPIKAEELVEQEFVQRINTSNVSSQRDSTGLEIQQLKQELKLKEDIIKKLEFVVEELEKEKEMFVSKTIQKESKKNADLDTIYSVTEDQNIINLEQKNKMLTDNIESIKEKDIKSLTSGSEAKLKGNEGERKLDEFQISGL